jgi:hypothetical protein
MKGKRLEDSSITLHSQPLKEANSAYVMVEFNVPASTLRIKLLVKKGIVIKVISPASSKR